MKCKKKIYAENDNNYLHSINTLEVPISSFQPLTFRIETSLESNFLGFSFLMWVLGSLIQTVDLEGTGVDRLISKKQIRLE